MKGGKCIKIYFFRYQPLPDLISRLKQLHHQHRIISKRLERMKSKIEAASEVNGILVDEQTHNDFVDLTKTSEVSTIVDGLPEDSFRSLFWKQQCEAASKKNYRNMRWHPLMIRWCLDLRRR